MKSELRQMIATCVVCLGLLLVGTGFLWPLAANPDWPQAKAEEFAESSAAFHAAAHAHEGKIPEDELAAIRQRFEKIKAELQTVRQRPAKIAYWLKLVGGAMAAIGLMILLAARYSHS